MKRILSSSSLLVLLLPILSLICVHGIIDNSTAANAIIPNQYIVFYTKDADREATNERLFFSTNSAIASSDSFSIVHEMDKAIAVTGITTEEQYQALVQDPFVEKVIPVRNDACV